MLQWSWVISMYVYPSCWCPLESLFVFCERKSSFLFHAQFFFGLDIRIGCKNVVHSSEGLKEVSKGSPKGRSTEG